METIRQAHAAAEEEEPDWLADAAQQMGEKLAEAQAKAADLEHSLQQSTAREAALRKENESLITKLTELLQMRAQAMDTEREEFEAQAAERSSNTEAEPNNDAPSEIS